MKPRDQQHSRQGDSQPRAKRSRKTRTGPPGPNATAGRGQHASQTEGPQRLQKVLAAAGFGSRRHCEELILAGRVEVDRQVVSKLGTCVDPHVQEVRLDGTPLPHLRKVYYLVHKPSGVVSTNHDPAGRPRVIDLLPETRERLFTVGRLDLSSEGLILVTNDGELANRLAHPRYGVEKTYQVLVAGCPQREVLDQLRHGVHLAEGWAKAVSVRVKTALKQSTVLEIVLAEGRNREIRRLLARVGHKVLRLKRISLGPVRLQDLPPGEFRRLTGEELRQLHAASRRGHRPASRLPEQSPSSAKELAGAAAVPAGHTAAAKIPPSPRPRAGRRGGGRPVVRSRRSDAPAGQRRRDRGIQGSPS